MAQWLVIGRANNELVSDSCYTQCLNLIMQPDQEYVYNMNHYWDSILCYVKPCAFSKLAIMTLVFHQFQENSCNFFLLQIATGLCFLPFSSKCLTHLEKFQPLQIYLQHNPELYLIVHTK